MLVDNGSSVNILAYSTYQKMGLVDSELLPCYNDVYGFTGPPVLVVGRIKLPVTLGEEPRTATRATEFLVVNEDISYNGIIGRPMLREMRIITSIHHFSIKFPTPNGIGWVKGCHADSRECYSRALYLAMRASRHLFDGGSSEECYRYLEPANEKNGNTPQEWKVKSKRESCNAIMIFQHPGEEPYTDVASFQGVGTHKEVLLSEAPKIGKITEVVEPLVEGVVEEVNDTDFENLDVSDVLPEKEEIKEAQLGVEIDLDPRMPESSEKAGTAGDTVSVMVDDFDPTKELNIGKQLSAELQIALTSFLKKNLDVFAWSHSDMLGVDPKVMCHHLNIDPDKRAIRQKRRAMSGERAWALKEEVDRLLKAGLIRESFYPMWLANPVLVKMPNGKWRTCVDFTDLNKACPKDSFPLPRIDQLVDSTAAHALLSFMDAYSGYNQIPMYEPDQEHTSFITDRGLYYYIAMPFGLDNVGATYQRLVNMMFKNQIGKTMEVYVDDMLVNSKVARDHIIHLSEMFNILRQFRMKLNPQKCIFGVESGKFLRFIVNHRGIEENPAKIKALLEMRSPQNVREVQSLTGRIAALNRFVSKSSDKCKEFFSAIKNGKNFEWTTECEEAFTKIKEQLGNPPLLSKPLEGETLLLYLAVSDYSISAVLVREDEQVQYPVYYNE
ncbi:uncharacterized protein LOC141716663 [Apium graveolens]|uniref:uncharacterized protein LOC141716663 n=1 Tax=Apium graveolens TaxID=4045 RepID=UPI003D7B8A63